MLHNIDRLRAELDRVRRPSKATITPVPGGKAIEVGVGDIVEIEYDGERRRVRVLAITAWGLRAWELDKGAPRNFRFLKIGVREQTP